MKKLFKSNEFIFLFLPIIVLIIIGLILESLKFKYTTQFVLICGPILSAFVALYISSNVAYKAQLYSKEKNKSLLKHVTVILEESIKTANLERSNYQEFISDLKNKGIEQIWLKTTPFHFFKVISNFNKQELFDAIRSYDSKRFDLNEVYIKIVNDAENSLFIKSNAEQQYIRFIESFNRAGENWKRGQLELNQLYGEIDTSPTHAPFDGAYKGAIQNYTLLVRQGKINEYMINDIRANLSLPLEQVLQTHFFQHHYISQFQQTLKIVNMGLDKMEEIHNYIIVHLTGLISDLDLILTRLESAVKELKEMQTT